MTSEISFASTTSILYIVGITALELQMCMLFWNVGLQQEGGDQIIATNQWEIAFQKYVFFSNKNMPLARTT